MKFTILFLSLFVLGMVSCEEEALTGEIEDVEITLSDTSESSQTDIKLKKNQRLRLAMGKLGIEDSLVITEQAQNFETSELDFDAYPDVVYIYQPTAGFSGTETVQFRRCFSPGAGCGTEVFYTLKIKVK